MTGYAADAHGAAWTAASVAASNVRASQTADLRFIRSRMRRQWLTIAPAKPIAPRISVLASGTVSASGGVGGVGGNGGGITGGVGTGGGVGTKIGGGDGGIGPSRLSGGTGTGAGLGAGAGGGGGKRGGKNALTGAEPAMVPHTATTPSIHPT